MAPFTSPAPNHPRAGRNRRAALPAVALRVVDLDVVHGFVSGAGDRVDLRADGDRLQVVPRRRHRLSLYPLPHPVYPPLLSRPQNSDLDALRTSRPEFSRKAHQRRESNAHDDRRPGHGRHAERVRPQPSVHGARGAAADHGRTGAPHRHQASARPLGEVGCLHGRWLRPRHQASGGLHGPGDRRPQSRSRPAGRAPRPLSGDRHDRRPRSAHQVSRCVPGGRRPPRFRAGDQIQRHRRRRGALSRHDPPGVSRRHLRHARSGAPEIPGKRGPDRRRAGRHEDAVRTEFRATAAVPARAWR